LLTTLEDAIGRGQLSKCFEPRHAIRAAAKSKIVDLVSCFACGRYTMTIDGKEFVKGTGGIAHDARPTFDKMLKDAGVPLAKKRE
jgi:hypothetical protein